MIHYSLLCSSDHEFDGWFKDSAAFERQAKRGLVECPNCGDTGVTRALMAPAVPRKGNTLAEPVPAPMLSPSGASAPAAKSCQVAKGRMEEAERAALTMFEPHRAHGADE